MRYTTISDLAGVLGYGHDDANNFLKRYVHPDCLPSVPNGQRRLISERTAKLFAFAVRAREAGFSPEEVRGITRQHFKTIEKADAIVAALSETGGCLIVTATDAKDISLADFLGPWQQQGQHWLRMVLIADLSSKVALALAMTERDLQSKVELGNPPPKTEHGWGEDRRKTFVAQRDKAKAKAAAH